MGLLQAVGFVGAVLLQLAGLCRALRAGSGTMLRHLRPVGFRLRVSVLELARAVGAIAAVADAAEAVAAKPGIAAAAVARAARIAAAFEAATIEAATSAASAAKRLGPLRGNRQAGREDDAGRQSEGQPAAGHRLPDHLGSPAITCPCRPPRR